MAMDILCLSTLLMVYTILCKLEDEDKSQSGKL